MMRTIVAMLFFGVTVSLSACTATVQTYDGEGNSLGSCKTTTMLFGRGAICGGSANPKEQR